MAGKITGGNKPIAGEHQGSGARGRDVTSSRHHEAVRKLREMIISGELGPGERLREIAVSRLLEMSRTPVREAFKTLAAEGLVQLLPNRSVVVAQLDEENAIDVFAVLGVLESLAAVQATFRMSPAEIDEIGRLQEAMEAAFHNRDRITYTKINREIHSRIVHGARNPTLERSWRLVLPSAERARTLNTMDRHRWAVAVVSHRRIYSALTSRDADAIQALLLEHFDQVKIEKMARG